MCSTGQFGAHELTASSATHVQVVRTKLPVATKMLIIVPIGLKVDVVGVGAVPMGTRRQRSTGPKRTSTKQTKRASQPKKPIWRRPVTWLGGVATAVSVGILINVLSTQAQRIAPANASPAITQKRPPVNGPPLKVLSEDPINIEQLGTVVFPGMIAIKNDQLSSIQAIPESNYLSSRGAYPTLVNTQIAVQNNRSYSIQIIDMHVMKSCQAPLTGTLFYAPAQGAVESVQVGFNLDSNDTSAKVANGDSITSSSPDYFAKYTVSIDPGGKQVFDIIDETAQHSCTFRYQFTILDGGKKVYQTIGNGSQPFKIDAVIASSGRNPFGAYRALYVSGNFGYPGDENNRFAQVNPKSFAF